MIAHDRRFIFTHVPKAAGKSIRFLLGLPEFAHQFKSDSQNIEYGFGHYPLADFADRDYFHAYFKFAFVRNPYDRLVSAFAYLNSGGCNAVDQMFFEKYLRIYDNNFAAFAEDLPQLLTAQHFRPQVFWLCNAGGALLTDFVGRYENLEHDLDVIAKRLELSFAPPPVINASRHAPYRSYYDDATRRRVALAYAEDLERFKYRFPE
jgi:hypothetical protein